MTEDKSIGTRLGPFETQCAGACTWQPQMTVWYGAMPETNGKSNYTAILYRKDGDLEDGITLDRSEYPDRVRYEADRARFLIGEIAIEPNILDYDADAHSGYKRPPSRLELEVDHLKEQLEWQINRGVKNVFLARKHRNTVQEQLNRQIDITDSLSTQLEAALSLKETKPWLPEGCRIERGFDVLDKPFRFVDNKTHQPTIKITFPPCEVDDPEAWKTCDAAALSLTESVDSDTVQWLPIEDAPRNNERPLLLAYFSEDGQLQAMDFGGRWESGSESWELPQIYYYWESMTNTVDEPTHWAYQPSWFDTIPPYREKE